MTPHSSFRQRSFRRKIIYLALIVCLLVPLALLAQPRMLLDYLRTRHKLSQTDLGKIDPAGETIKLAAFGLDGLAANLLWGRAYTYKMKKDWTNLSATLEQIATLQPNFVAVWRFQAWNLSYNVSIEFDDFRQRYHWVIRGINFLKERGIKYNDREPRLMHDVGKIICNKIGRSDERLQFRRLFKLDDRFHQDRPMDERDNWLVGKWWLREAERVADLPDTLMKGMNPLVFRSEAPMAQASYADALEEDGVFGRKAGNQWELFGEEWHDFGNWTFYTQEEKPLKLNDLDKIQKEIERLAAELDSLDTELRAKITARKRAALTDQEREALDTPRLERSGEQQGLAIEAERKVEVSHEDVASEISGEDRPQGLELARKLLENEEQANPIGRYRHVVNFTFWKQRAAMEQEADTLAARKLTYEGNRAFVDSDLNAAKEAYDKGFQMWRGVLDKYPKLGPDPILGGDLMETIERYQDILRQLDDDNPEGELPEGFPLQDVFEHHEASW